jgi:general secretion pathway protein L
MSKRLIGIEIGERTLRVATLNREKNQITVNALVERNFTDQAELTELLSELLSEEFNIGDQLVTYLPARSAYVRRLTFPFLDEKKITAALPFELAAQLPVSIDDCATAMQKIQQSDEGASVSAAAVPKETLQSLLDLFENVDVPLHRIDLAPFCHVASLGEQIRNGILICATDQETTVSLLENGHLKDYRVLQATPEPASMPHYQALLREIKVLTHMAETQELAISLMGAGATTGLAEALQTSGLQVDMLSLNLGGQYIETAFLPAVALALQAKSARSSRSFNFRQGPYALKGEWANLKGKLALLIALLGVTILVLCGSMTFKYLDKAGRAEQLQNEMVKVYRSLFPNATTIVDVPMQLQSAIRDLQEKNSLVASEAAPPLDVLKAVSRLSEVVTIEIREFAMGPEDLKMSGWTISFEAVNQIAKGLEDTEMFGMVQVTDAKMSLDGSRIDFRLLLSYAGQEGTQ